MKIKSDDIREGKHFDSTNNRNLEAWQAFSEE